MKGANQAQTKVKAYSFHFEGKKLNSIVKIILIIIVGGLVLFGLAQLIPVDRTNPPVVTQVTWDSPQTAVLFKRACADCHSNETVWPWYSYVAPVSWLVAHDVSEGRAALNLSELDPSSARYQRMIREVGEKIMEGEMPKAIYYPTHPEARLTTEETQALASGLQTTLNNFKK